MIHKLIPFSKKQTNQHQPNTNKDQLTKPEPFLTSTLTVSQFRQQVKIIQSKINALKSKRNCPKESQWGNLNADINQLKKLIDFSSLKAVFQRKYEQEIRLLDDQNSKKYRQSIFKCCFFCCPNGMIRQMKYYKFIDDQYQIAVCKVQKTQRNIYFYLNLLYAQLFMMLVTVRDKVQEELSKKMIHAMTVEAKEKKMIEKRNKEVAELEEIDEIFVMEEENFKDLGQTKQIQSYIIQSDKPAIRNKIEPQEPMNLKIIHENHYDELKLLEEQVLNIISCDWKDIIDIEEWTSHSYYGFIQLNKEQPIETYLEFKDYKLKTNYLFNQISSSSFDLRTYLVRRSKSPKKSYQFVLQSLHSDSVEFELRFWLADKERTTENHENIEKFILLSMRIGIKQKIFRMCNFNHKGKTKNWMIRNYVHMDIKEGKENQSKEQNNNQNIQNTSFESISEAESIMNPEEFWWANLGSELIRAIVEVAAAKIKNKKQASKFKCPMWKSKAKKVSQEENKPQTNSRLLKMSKQNSYSGVNQI